MKRKNILIGICILLLLSLIPEPTLAFCQDGDQYVDLFTKSYVIVNGAKQEDKCMYKRSDGKYRGIWEMFCNKYGGGSSLYSTNCDIWGAMYCENGKCVCPPGQVPGNCQIKDMSSYYLKECRCVSDPCSNKNCNDNNPCTSDSCSNGNCINSRVADGTTCPSGACRSGSCETICTPNCAGKSCGDNGCGGSCGSCGTGNTCSGQGQCIGSYACTGTEPFGAGVLKGPSTNSDSSRTLWQHTVWSLTPCSWKCDSGYVINGIGCRVACTPNCAGKSCGDNGCGGNCGNCPSGQSCSNGNCIGSTTCSAGWTKFGNHCEAPSLSPSKNPQYTFNSNLEGWVGSTINKKKYDLTTRFANALYIAAEKDNTGNQKGVFTSPPISFPKDMKKIRYASKLYHDPWYGCIEVYAKKSTEGDNAFTKISTGEGYQRTKSWYTYETSIPEKYKDDLVVRFIAVPCDGSTTVRLIDNICISDSQDNCLTNCIPSCNNKQCGDDGCGGSCGSCTGGRSCFSNQCACLSGQHWSGSSCISDNCDGTPPTSTTGTIKGPTSYSTGSLSWTYTTSASTSTPCKWKCSNGYLRSGNSCTPSCTPNCAGKSCGDDGCGGSCGSCTGESNCASNQCICPAGKHFYQNYCKSDVCGFIPPSTTEGTIKGPSTYSTGSLSWTYTASATTSTPCKWKCDTGYLRNSREDGQKCNPITYECIGIQPSGSNVFKGPAITTQNNNPWTYSSSASTTTPCLWKCPSGFNQKGNTCEGEKDCEITNGQGKQTFNGNDWSSCQLESCNSGFHPINNGCLSDTEPCSTDKGSGVKNWLGSNFGPCVLDHCNTGLHLENQNCIPDKQPCEKTNGVGEKTWQGSAYSECLVKSCSTNYHEENKECVADIQPCTKSSGSGSKTWQGSGYGECILTDCNTGLHLDNKICVSDVEDCNIDNGQGERNWAGDVWGVCMPKSCNSGYHKRLGVCELDVLPCEISNGAGEKTWQASDFSQCQVKSCNSEYHIKDNGCVPNVEDCTKDKGKGKRTWSGSWGECKLENCDLSYHIENNNCLPNEKPCNSGGGSGKQIWTGSGYSDCTLDHCPIGKHIFENTCVTNTEVCNIDNGVGERSWLGSDWGVCLVKTCDSGWHKISNTCQSNEISCSGTNGEGKKHWNVNSYGNCILDTCSSGFELKNNQCLCKDSRLKEEICKSCGTAVDNCGNTIDCGECNPCATAVDGRQPDNTFCCSKQKVDSLPICDGPCHTGKVLCRGTSTYCEFKNIGSNCGSGKQCNNQGKCEEITTSLTGCQSCTECGGSIFDSNLCDKQECSTCGSCYYTQFIFGTCSNCGDASCEDFSTDDCTNNACGINTCIVKDSKCCKDADNDGNCDVRTDVFSSKRECSEVNSEDWIKAHKNKDSGNLNPKYYSCQPNQNDKGNCPENYCVFNGDCYPPGFKLDIDGDSIIEECKACKDCDIARQKNIVSCLDADGVALNKKSTCIDGKSQYVDSCSGEKVVEYSCEVGSCKSNKYSCPLGSKCENGKCSCIESSKEEVCRNKCGTVTGSCGKSYECGGCSDGKGCVNNVCICKDDRSDLTVCGSNDCGKVNDRCGKLRECKGCDDGYRCNLNSCVSDGIPGSLESCSTACQDEDGCTCKSYCVTGNDVLNGQNCGDRKCSGARPLQNVIAGQDKFTDAGEDKSWSYTDSNPGLCEFSCANGAIYQNAQCLAPIAHWDFDQLQDGKYVDKINGYTAELHNGVDFTEAKGFSVYLDGIDDYLSTNLDVSENKERTYVAWVSLKDLNNKESGIVSTGEKGQGIVIKQGSWNPEISAPTGSSLYSSGERTKRNWELVASMYHNDHVSLYYNTKSFTQPTSFFGQLNTESTNNLMIGKYKEGFFPGFIDELRVYEGVLDKEDVEKIKSEEESHFSEIPQVPKDCEFYEGIWCSEFKSSNLESQSVFREFSEEIDFKSQNNPKDWQFGSVIWKRKFNFDGPVQFILEKSGSAKMEINGQLVNWNEGNAWNYEPQKLTYTTNLGGGTEIILYYVKAREKWLKLQVKELQQLDDCTTQCSIQQGCKCPSNCLIDTVVENGEICKERSPPIAYWDFNNDPDGKSVDVLNGIIANHEGVLRNVDGSLFLTGYGEALTNIDIGEMPELTLMTWVYAKPVWKEVSGLIGGLPNKNNKGIYLGYYDHGSWGQHSFSLGVGNSKWNILNVDNNWHHIAVVYLPNEIRVFKDGQIQSNHGLVYDPEMFLDNQIFKFGAGDEKVKAVIDNVRVFNREVRNDEIMNLYEQEKNDFTSAPDLTAGLDCITGEFYDGNNCVSGGLIHIKNNGKYLAESGYDQPLKLLDSCNDNSCRWGLLPSGMIRSLGLPGHINAYFGLREGHNLVLSGYCADNNNACLWLFDIVGRIKNKAAKNLFFGDDLKLVSDCKDCLWTVEHISDGFCGNFLVDEGEECDDSNKEEYDGCTIDCKSINLCEYGEITGDRNCVNAGNNFVKIKSQGGYLKAQGLVAPVNSVSSCFDQSCYWRFETNGMITNKQYPTTALNVIGGSLPGTLYTHNACLSNNVHCLWKFDTYGRISTIFNKDFFIKGTNPATFVQRCKDEKCRFEVE